MSTTAGNLKSLMAIYMGRTTASDLTINGFDAGLFALNAARRKVERLHDFAYAGADVTLSIASTGTALAATTKRVIDVQLPIAAGDYIPIEFMTEDEWLDRLRRQAGRSVYSAAATIASLGVSNTNPVCYQQGQTLYLVPASQFSFPVSARLNCIQFQSDYTGDSSHDFFTDYAPEYLQWQAILEVNKHFRRFAPKEEGNIDEAAVEGFAKEALESLIQWDTDIRKGTSTPPELDVQRPR